MRYPSGLPILPWALAVCLLSGCATNPDPGEQPEDGPHRADELATTDQDDDLVCVRDATVTVRVQNRSSFDIELKFGQYKPARAADGFSLTTYQIPRYYLKDFVALRILRGGLQVGGPSVIQTEPVLCNIATLVIGSRPAYSIFYGDELLEPVRKSDDEDEAEEAEQVPEEESERG